MTESCTDDQLADWNRRTESVQRADGKESWELLGYEAADYYLLSAIANAGLDPLDDDVELLRAFWAPKLNRYHLFANRKDAQEFREFANVRIKEHAPFFVFGVWLLEELKTGH